MAKKISKKDQTVPSQREMDLLKILWKGGELPVRAVHETLCQTRPCAFTTVQTLLRIMADKGLVRVRNEGRTLYYSSNYTVQQASSRFLDKVFDGAVDQLVANLLRAEDLSVDDLQELESLISSARKEKQQKKGK